MTLHRLHRGPILAAAGVGLVAGVLLFWATAHGVGASRDSCNYFHFARVLLGQELVQDIDGSGPQVVLTHYPPVYPAMLAGIAAIGVKLLNAARLINLLSFAATAMLFTALVYRVTGSIWRLLIAAVLVLAQPAVAGVQFWAVSEPPFFVAQIAAMWCLIEYLASDRPKPWRFAAMAGFALAAGNFTRYIGGALFPAACVTVLLAPRVLREKLVGLAWLIGCFAGPMVVLAVTQHLLLDSVTHRSIEYHPLSSGHWWNLLTTFTGWFASPELFGTHASWIAWALIAASAVLLLPLAAFCSDGAKYIIRIAAPGIVIYVALLMLSVAFVDNATPVDDRLLAPAAILLMFWLITSIRLPRSAIAKAAITILIVLPIVASNGYRAGKQISVLRTQGFGFNHIAFRNSPLVKACKSIPQATPIYSNYPEAIFLHANHLAAILPGRPTAIGRESGDPMEAAFERMEKGLANGGYVAYFGFRAGKNVAAIPVSIDELQARIPLKVHTHTKDGTLLKAIPLSATQPATQATQPGAQTGATTTAVP